MRCTAETFRGHRCKNTALVDEDVCTVHYRLREERAHQTTQKGERPPARAIPRDERRDGSRDPEARDETTAPPPGGAGGPLEGNDDPGDPSAIAGLVREHEDAAAGESRDRVEIDPALFEDLEADEKAASEPAEPSGPAAPRPPPRGALLDANPGPWSPSALEGVLLPPLNRKFSADDVAELEGAEAEVFLEAVAASLNRIASRVDPNNPYAALVLSSSIMVGTRYVPRLIRARRNGAAESDGESSEPEASAAAASSAEADGPTLADQFIPDW